MRTTKLVTISMVPELLEKAENLAKEENRTRSEFFREAIRNYIEEREWKRLHRYGMMKAQEMGLKEEDVERLVSEHRHGKLDD